MEGCVCQIVVHRNILMHSAANQSKMPFQFMLVNDISHTLDLQEALVKSYVNGRYPDKFAPQRNARRKRRTSQCLEAVRGSGWSDIVGH